MRSWHWRPPSFFFPNTVYETGSSPSGVLTSAALQYFIHFRDE
jgi:hypothetical protein